MSPSGFQSNAPSSGLGTLSAELPAPAAPVQADLGLWAVVLAGGIGSRFWPVSSPTRPKQLLALVSDQPLIAETVGRLAPLIPADRVLVVTSRDIAPAIAAAIPSVPAENLLIEPRPLGTAAAVAWAAHEIASRAGPDTVFCTLHADLAVAFPDAFRHVVREASRLASNEDVLVAVGVRGDRAEPGFGYILAGPALDPDAPLADGGACEVETFVEKPSPDAARRLLDQGALWNAGIFVWRTRVLLAGLGRFTPELSAAMPRLRARDHEAFAATVRSISIERGLLERADCLVVVPGEFGWDDVGTWGSLRRARELDDDGNGAVGPTHFVDATANIVHAEGARVVLYGVSGMLVVTLPGLTFVTTLDKATDLKALLDSLPPDLRQGGSPGPAR